MIDCSNGEEIQDSGANLNFFIYYTAITIIEATGAELFIHYLDSLKLTNSESNLSPVIKIVQSNIMQRFISVKDGERCDISQLIHFLLTILEKLTLLTEIMILLQNLCIKSQKTKFNFLDD